MDSQALRRMIAGQEAAAEAARVARQAYPNAQAAFDAAMELWDLRPDLFDRPPDAVRLREIEGVRAAWARLRERLRT